MKRRDELPTPVNAMERLLYAIAVRQDILIEQMNSVVDYIAKEKKVATTTNTNVEKVVTTKPVAKPVQSVIAEAKVEAKFKAEEPKKPTPKRAPRKTTAKKSECAKKEG